MSLSEADTQAGLQLSAEVGWNQTETDWSFLLRHGIGLGFESDDSTLVASATLLPYMDRFAWIGMVLVSQVARRQGLATALLRATLAISAERRWVPLLDATAEGRSVYLPLGFRDSRTFTRWTGEAFARPDASPVPVHSISTASDLAQCAAWDALRFGASRQTLLQHLHQSRVALALRYVNPAGELNGFALARTGRTATHLGPLVADTPVVAEALLRAALSRAQGPLLLDIADDQSFLANFLRERGFAPRRHFIRMILGEAVEPGRPDCLRAIAGPEFG